MSYHALEAAFPAAVKWAGDEDVQFAPTSWPDPWCSTPPSRTRPSPQLSGKIP